MVLVASDHLILSRERPIEPLWITYYVFMTLNFDNMLPSFRRKKVRKTHRVTHAFASPRTWALNLGFGLQAGSLHQLRPYDGAIANLEG